MRKIYFYCLSIVLCLQTLNSVAQTTATDQSANDFNAPLHLLKPTYKTPYGNVTPDQVKAVTDRVFALIDASTPAQVIDKRSHLPLTDLNQLDQFSGLQNGLFRITSYEWGVTYAGMLITAQTTGDQRYRKLC